MSILYPLSGERADSMPLTIAEVHEMVVSHSAFLPSILDRTSTDVKGEDLAWSNLSYQRTNQLRVSC